MSLIGFLIATFFSGLIVGALARLALPGRDPMSIWQTAAVGVAGSFGAGLLVALLTNGRYTAGFVASFAGAFLIVYLIRRSRGGSLTHPGTPSRRV
ncbi:MAG: GlsB/YeaQ/YmgE family stress response rane protein [Solirubrobacterales bacterium]|nr:GlsB/YeaQ/YmgE family stress response rane protein [Solirubrobacterales bacterium]